MKKKHKTGIYLIRHKDSRKVYVGSARNLVNRKITHTRALIKGIHTNRYLQRSWKKYGATAFEFVVLLFCSETELLFYEQRAIDVLKANYPKYGYNLRSVAHSNSGLRGDALWKRIRKLTAADVVDIRSSFSTVKALAESYNVSVGTITNILYGITYKWVVGEKVKRSYKKLSPEQVCEIRISSEVQTILARKYNVSQSAINQIRIGNTYADIPCHTIERSIGKLKDADICMIRHSNKTQKELAKDFNISQSLVSMIKSGLRYG